MDQSIPTGWRLSVHGSDLAQHRPATCHLIGPIRDRVGAGNQYQFVISVYGLDMQAAAGPLFMLTLLFAADYPGPQAPFWLYWGAALPHLGLFLCFVTFLFGDAEQRFSLQLLLERKQIFRAASGSSNA